MGIGLNERSTKGKKRLLNFYSDITKYIHSLNFFKDMSQQGICASGFVNLVEKCGKKGTIAGSSLEWHGISNQHFKELVKLIRMVERKVCANELIPE